jgi:hypothetical protein
MSACNVSIARVIKAPIAGISSSVAQRRWIIAAQLGGCGIGGSRGRLAERSGGNRHLALATLDKSG